MSLPKNKLLAKILEGKTAEERAWMRGLAGLRSVDCPKCGGRAFGLYFDQEVYSQFVEEPMCECGWMGTSLKVPYPRLEKFDE